MGENIEGYLFILPWILGFLFFQAGPMVASFVFSFMEYDMVRTAKFIGFENYGALFQDHLFWKALVNTSYYVFVGTPLRVLIALFLALLINQRLIGRNLFRALFFIPSVITGFALGMLWSMVLQPEYGMVNSILSSFGIKGPAWVRHPLWAMPSIIMVAMWGMGTAMVIFLAGLQAIPHSLYESADIDGARPWQKLIRITLPMLSPTIFFNVVITVISSFQVFAKVYAMTEGGPLNATLVYVFYLYRVGFEYFKMGYGSALAMIFFVMIFGLTMIQFRMSRAWVHYEV